MILDEKFDSMFFHVGFDGILWKCNRGLVLLVEENSKLQLNFSLFSRHFWHLVFLFLQILDLLGTSFYIIPWFQYFIGTSFFHNLFSIQQFLKAVESPLKMMKNAYYFTSKALFVLKIFKSLSWLFGYASKRLDKKDKVNFKFYTSQPV